MRVKYYDLIKTLGIFIVLSFHQVWIRDNVPATVAMSFVPIAVPMFFMVHGALLLSKDTTVEKQKKRFLHVLLQLYVWNTIYLIVSLCTALTSPREVTPRFLFEYYFCKADSSGITSGHLWFVYALLVIYALYPLFDVCRKHNEKVLRYVAVACFVCSFVREEILVYLNYFCQLLTGQELVTEWLLSRVGPYFNAVFYFIFGYYLSRFIQTNSTLKARKKKYMVLSGLGVLAGVTLLILERYVVFGSINYNWKPLPDQYEKIGTFIAAVSLYIFCSFFEFKNERCYRVINCISTHTFDIFYIHVIYARLARVYLYQYEFSGVWHNYLRALIILILSYYTGQVLRKLPGKKLLF